MPRIHCHPLIVPEAAVDAHGHANNLEYLRWMVDAAVQHSAAQGWPAERYLELGQSWFVRSHTIEYLRPADAGERVAIVTWVAGTDERSSPRRYWCVRMRDRRVLAKAETVWIWVDLHTGRARPIPERVRQAFEVVTDENEVTEFVATCLPEDEP